MSNQIWFELSLLDNDQVAMKFILLSQIIDFVRL